MYTNDKTNRITLRLNNKQFEYVKVNADLLGVSPSEFLRMVINATISLAEKSVEMNEKKEGNGRENDKANINDIV